MTVSHKPAISAPTSAKGVGTPPSSKPPKTPESRQQFLVAALNMSWQLAIVVLVPIIGGVKLGKALGAPSAWTFAGLGVALIGSGLVMWRAMQVANRLPVPKLTDAQKRAIRKSYEEEDKD